MHRLALLLCFTTSIALADDVRADERSDASTPTIVTRKSWYGWQPLLCDAAAAASFVGGGELYAHSRDRAGTAMLVTGGTIFLTCAPIVHLAHAHPARALGDFALRFLMPAISVSIGIAMDQSERDNQCRDCFPIWTFIGAYAGAWTMAAAVAVDATIMSREEKRMVTEPSAFRIAPDIESIRGGGTVGVRGSF